MILQKDHYNQIVATIDLGALKFKEFSSYIIYKI